MAGEFSGAAASALVFLSVLPLVNGVFDFASIGLTRWALRHGLEWPGPRMWLWAGLDLAAAAALFLALKAAAVLAVAGLNAAAGGGPRSGLLDLAELFAAIRQNPQDYWWLYLSFLTTLIPTLLHGVVAAFSLGVWLPRRLHLRWARLIPETENDWGHRQEVYWGLSLWLTFATALPVVLLWWGWAALHAAHADLGGGLLAMAEAVARAVGAVP